MKPRDGCDDPDLTELSSVPTIKGETIGAGREMAASSAAGTRAQEENRETK